MRWHFYLTPPANGAYNMALDEALMRRAARTGDAVFRVYGWSTPTLSLGRNQRARNCYDRAKATELGVSFVRRPTGGRAILHHHEVTYSATMPSWDAAAARGAYDFINDVLLRGMEELGVPATRATRTHAIPPGPRPCFDLPADREIELGGRKLIGSAQWRHAGGLLQHGSILVRDDQPLIARLLASTDEVTPAAATLVEALGREPLVEEVAHSIRAALVQAIDGDVDQLEAERLVEADAAATCATYEDDTWTWRR